MSGSLPAGVSITYGTLTYDDRAPEHLRGTTVETFEITRDGRFAVGGVGTRAEAEARLAEFVAEIAPTQVRFADGTTVTLPHRTATTVVGLSEEGYVVVADHGIQYGLTPCCHASAKGDAVGIVCRSCYHEVDPFLGGPMEVAIPVTTIGDSA